MMVFMTKELFFEEADKILHVEKRNARYKKEMWGAIFGTTAAVAATIWNKIPTIPGSHPRHLLWACMFLHLRGSEKMNKVFAKVDDH